ncbi:protein FAM81B [Anguilla rostrata]|uniref:protein FAM81B n=1 Tax=Anguilla rostrata TaxID=7938 RepID=UPI0030D4983A
MQCQTHPTQGLPGDQLKHILHCVLSRELLLTLFKDLLPRGKMSQEAMMQLTKPHSDKSNFLEGRLTNQERIMGKLLEQAFRIKDEVVASLHATQGSVQSEALSHRLLENHIQTITQIVKQLSKDIEVLEGQIIQRDGITSGTSFAVQSLDHKNLAGIGDLRGRVARCDASIAKLSGDVAAGGAEIQKLHQEVLEVRAGVEVQLKETELELTKTERRLEALLLEHSGRLRKTQGDLQKETQLLSVRTSSGLKELGDRIDRLKEWAEQQLRSSAQTQVQGSEQLGSQLQNRMEEVERRLQEQAELLSARVEKAERQMEKEHKANRVKRSEDKMAARIAALEKNLRAELDLIRDEYHSGFQSIRDAVGSLRQIGDTQARIDKEQLQKDLKRIRRKMVALQDP